MFLPWSILISLDKLTKTIISEGQAFRFIPGHRLLTRVSLQSINLTFIVISFLEQFLALRLKSLPPLM